MSLPMGELRHHLCVWVPSQFGRSTAVHVLHHVKVGRRPLHACQTLQAKESLMQTLWQTQPRPPSEG